MEQDIFITTVAALRPELERAATQWYDGDAAKAEDAVSELLLRLWQRRHELDAVERPKAYCLTLLKRLVIDDLRTTHTLPMDNLLPDTGSTDGEQQYELNELLAKAIAQLPHLRRQVYEMHELQAYESTQIASILNIRVEAVHNHLSRARKQMRDFLMPLMQ